MSENCISLGTEYGVNGERLGEPNPIVEIERRPILPSIVEGLPSSNCGSGVNKETLPSLS